MSFTKIAEAERKRILSKQRRDDRLHWGWYASSVKPQILDELSIEYEVEDSQSSYTPGVQVYAPVWVYGVWFNAGMPVDDDDSRWDIVRSLLVATRDSTHEQEMVTAELTLEGSISSSARSAARNLVEVLQGHRKTEVSDERP